MPSSRNSTRYVVVVSRWDLVDGAFSVDQVVLGPFRRIEAAEARAETMRRLARKYEDPEGVTGDDNALSVKVQPIRSGALAARDAMDYLYGSIVDA